MAKKEKKELPSDLFKKYKAKEKRQRNVEKKTIRKKRKGVVNPYTGKHPWAKQIRESKNKLDAWRQSSNKSDDRTGAMTGAPNPTWPKEKKEESMVRSILDRIFK